MFTKMVLPLLGGAPAVWNTAMLFFQSTLLVGYAYAHVISSRFSLHKQILIHISVLAVAFTALPLAVASGWTPPESGTPAYWLIGLYGASIGLPFFAVSSTAPLLQRWFSYTGHKTANDPYFLYGASNLGSILALLCYPVLLEPALALVEQARTWTLGYMLLTVAIGLSACYALWSFTSGRAETDRPASAPSGDAAAGAETIRWSRRLTWTALTFAPSSLMLGVTAHITTDIAVTPFLWVIPLTLYLLTFVLVFARRPVLKHAWMVRAQPFFVITLACLFWAKHLLLLNLLLHFSVFFVMAMVCHGDLVRRRPGARHLTEFYLWMSVGGVLGGLFNAIVAPAVFDGVYEYPLAVVIACMLRPWAAAEPRVLKWTDVAVPLLPLALIFTAIHVLRLPVEQAPGIVAVAVFVVFALIAYRYAARPIGFGIAIAAIIAILPISAEKNDQLAGERSFFGVYRVKVAKYNGTVLHTLVHGTTIHGAQLQDIERRREPIFYFHRSGPLGQVFSILEGQPSIRTVGVVGLGSGAIACYRRPSQSWTFYEIDPLVTEMARDTRYFSYLSDCAPDAKIVHGDARLSLDKVSDGHYDLLILDAFSSDSIPMHLMTREALALYLQKLAPGGLLMFHISNRHLDLVPVASGLVDDAGVSARYQDYLPTPAEAADFARLSTWMAIAENAQTLSFLAGNPRWSPVGRQLVGTVWTDDYSNIFGALRR